MKQVKCPYNSNHVMPPMRLQWHLTKCPDKRTQGHLFASCPFNAVHIVRKEEIEKHKLSCPDKLLMDDFTEFNDIDMEMRKFVDQKVEKKKIPLGQNKDQWHIEEEKTVGGNYKQNAPGPTRKPRRRRGRNKSANGSKNSAESNGSTDSNKDTHNAVADGTDPSKNLRNLKKKLKQIEQIELKISQGVDLNEDQLKKVKTKPQIEEQIAALAVELN